MIDYSEGCTQMKRLAEAIWQAMLDHNPLEAKELCDELVVTARLTKAQITIQTRPE